MRSGDLIFKYLFKCWKNKECAWYKTDKHDVLVDCGRIDGAIGIICNNTEWVGNRVTCANRLALMGADLDKTF